jgi:VanZ family protein
MPVVPVHRLAFRPAWMAAGWAFVALVVFLSLTPDPLPAAELGRFDIGHAAAYAWLGYWFAQLHAAPRLRLLVAAALGGLGIGLEFAQGWTGYRTFSYGDMRDDAIGALAGVALASTRLGGFLQTLDARIARAISG